MSGSSLVELLDQLPGQRILLVGDVMLDEYLWGEGTRLSPEAPVPVVQVQRRTCAPGGAGNAAVNVRGLGGVPVLGGLVGKDAMAGTLVEVLRQHGVDTEGLVTDAGRPATSKTRLVAQGQQVVRIDSEGREPLPPAAEATLLRWARRQVDAAEVCVLSDYGKGVVTPRLAQHLITAFVRASKPVIIDPKGSDYGKYYGATLIKPNLHELERLLKEEFHSEAALHAAGSRLSRRLGGTAVLVTRGSQGMSLCRRGMVPVRLPALARQVFDVTGAGDTVVATLALALAAGASLEDAMLLANVAAGVSVGKRGAATVSVAELQEALSALESAPAPADEVKVEGARATA